MQHLTHSGPSPLGPWGPVCPSLWGSCTGTWRPFAGPKISWHRQETFFPAKLSNFLCLLLKVITEKKDSFFSFLLFINWNCFGEIKFVVDDLAFVVTKELITKRVISLMQNLPYFSIQGLSWFIHFHWYNKNNWHQSN